MDSFPSIEAVLLVGVLLAALWVSTQSMRRRLRSSLADLEEDGWVLHGSWYESSVRAKGTVAERAVVVELVGTVRSVLRIAVECRGKHAVRVLTPGRFSGWFNRKSILSLSGPQAVIASTNEEREFGRRLIEDNDGAELVAEFFQAASAEVVWIAQDSVLGVSRRRIRRVLKPHRMREAVLAAVGLASLVERKSRAL